MEDSSTNPYIPQQSEDIRKKVYQRQSPLGRVVKWSLIATIVVAVLVGAGLFFVVPETTKVDQAARQKLADALQPPEEMHKRVNVQSKVGFSLNYDNRIYSSYGEVGDSSAGTEESVAVLAGQTYENNDLRTLRAYNYIRIRPIESVDSVRALAPLPPELEVFATVSDEELTKAAAVPENKGLSKLSLFVKMDTDKRLAKRVADDKTIVTIEASKPISRNMGGIDYQKVRYTTTNDNYRVSNTKYDDCYYTIQNNQPYSICISGVRPFNVSAASLVERVFDSITFEAPSTDESTEPTNGEGDKTSFIKPVITLAQASGTDDKTEGDAAEEQDMPAEVGESPLITVTPNYYKDSDSLSAIATNQPSVVRIGMLYCADLTLKFESGETATSLTDACAGSMSTGVFVSRDGHIATTGHAIRTQKKAAISGYINFAPDTDSMLDRLQRILDYLLEAKIILQSDAEYLKSGVAIGDQEALAKVQNIASVIPDKFITPVKEKYTYAVQPTEKPIVINRTDALKPEFAYSDSVLSAKYVASLYDAKKSVQEVFNSATPTVDIGLLKVEGSFPDVVVATSEDIKSNDVLNTIGFPAYTDSSLTIDRIRNMPVAQVSKVDQAYQKDGTRLIQTNMPVMPGHDGAPVFDNNGQLVGFAVYGLSYCPDQQCFGTGTVRSVKELWQLLDENNIELDTGSEYFADWKKGVDEYMRANYVTSADMFGESRDYSFNRWAEPLQKLARTHQGTQYDTSFMNQLQFVMIIALIVLVIVTIGLAAAFIVHRKRIDMMQVGHYGADASTQSATPQPVASTLPPPIMNANSPSTMQVPVYGQPVAPVQPQPGIQMPPPAMQPQQQAAPLQAQAPTQPQASSQPQAAPVQPQVPSQLQTPQSFGQVPPVNPQTQPDVQAQQQGNTEQPLSGAVPPSEDPFYK